MLKIQNVVSTAYVGKTLDLKNLAKHLINIEYKPSKFIAAIMRIRNPFATCLIFPSGRLLITGAKSVEQSYNAARIFARKIQKVSSIKTSFKEFKVQNIVGNFEMKGKIDVNLFYTYNKNKCLYDPESFPGLKYKIDDKEKIVALVFDSGRIVITGAKDVKKINELADRMYRLLLRYKK